MNIDNRDFEILNNLNENELNKIINKLNIKFNNNDKKNKKIKKILKNHYINNDNLQLLKKNNNYNTYVNKYNLLKSSFLAGNDNNHNIKIIKKLEKII